MLCSKKKCRFDRLSVLQTLEKRITPGQPQGLSSVPFQSMTKTKL